jgi:hypothetical protein
VAAGIGIGSWFIAAALQVSGYQNIWVSIGLGLIGIFGFGYAGWHFLLDKTALPENLSVEQLRTRKRRRRSIMSVVHALPIIGIIVGGCLFVGCIAWALASNKAANSEIAQTLSRYVLPRHLTDKQIKAISEYLQGFDPQSAKIITPKTNSETSSYAHDFSNALTQGGWAVTVEEQDDLREGLAYTFTQTMANANAKDDPKHPKTNTLFYQAMQKAGITFPEGGGGSGINVTANSFVIRIGARRMDDGDLKVRELQRERARKTLEDEDL